MRLLPVLAVLIVFMLMFGCGDQKPPEQNQTGTNATNATNITKNNTPVTIIIGQQTNQTKEQNKTENKNETNQTVEIKELEYTNEPEEPLGVYFIYVGDDSLHGDAILLKKGDFNMLIDAGPAEKSGKVVDFLKSKGVDNVAIMISTTADPRRYGGINAVADNFRIQRYWWTGDAFDDNKYAAIATRMANITKGVDVIQDGYSVSYDGMDFTILNPPAKRFSDVNNDAIVMKVVDRNVSWLFTSDIQTGAQGRLVGDRAPLLKTDILEAPYYGVGQGIANIGVFLNKVRPQTVIISGSADESSKNGGSRDPLKRLLNTSQYNVTWYENYDNGTIRVISDGQTYVIDALGS
jgi:competence protein ComEC